MDYIVRGTLQARILEWVAVPLSRGSSQPRDQTQVSRIAGRFFTSWATGEAQVAEGYGKYTVCRKFKYKIKLKYGIFKCQNLDSGYLWLKKRKGILFICLFIFPFIFICWRLITLQCCSGFWRRDTDVQNRLLDSVGEGEKGYCKVALRITHCTGTSSLLWWEWSGLTMLCELPVHGRLGQSYMCSSPDSLTRYWA